jgi:Rrp44-like cold shock domain
MLQRVPWTKSFIAGRELHNCAIGGDIVVVELLLKACWLLPSNRAVDQEDVNVDGDDDDEVTWSGVVENPSERVEEKGQA